MKLSMVADHARWPRENDIIFNLSERAQKSSEEIGKEKVINATIGALMDDDGNLITLNTVFDEYKSLPNSEIAAYASIAGQDDYKEAVKKVCFAGNDPKGHIRVVASPGGSGAIKLAVWNYTNEGDVILTSDLKELNTIEKIQVARQLESLGVDVIEAGFTVSSPGDFSSVVEISKTLNYSMIKENLILNLLKKNLEK